ncbi:hypothetical protein LTS03_001603 [Exophiala xenobiotica]|nr:hypothetical protein LTS03_001603 [Exophiala xenobiotica]KAK5410251.1 hypothetical protein LTR06_006717 [Exophiala xenobiotica]
MSSNGETVPEGTNEVTSQLGEVGKGKGKAVEQPRAMEEDEESEEESAAEEVYSPLREIPVEFANSFLQQPEPEEDEDEDMEEIDPDNIIQGRTRRKQINWAEAEQKSKDAGDEIDDDEDEEDDDFEAEDDDEEMKG